MASQTLNSPEYKAVYAAIAASTYWYRQGALVKAPRYAVRIAFSNGGLRLKLGANHLNLTAIESQITWRIHYLLKLFDGDRNVEGLALKVVLTEKRWMLELHLQDAISCCVERYDNESYSSYPITNGFLITHDLQPAPDGAGRRPESRHGGPSSSLGPSGVRRIIGLKAQF